MFNQILFLVKFKHMAYHLKTDDLTLSKAFSETTLLLRIKIKLKSEKSSKLINFKTSTRKLVLIDSLNQILLNKHMPNNKTLYQ